MDIEILVLRHEIAARLSIEVTAQQQSEQQRGLIAVEDLTHRTHV
jgi:hypothetical protein